MSSGGREFTSKLIMARGTNRNRFPGGFLIRDIQALEKNWIFLEELLAKRFR